MIEKEEKRRHSRCGMDREIVFWFGNQTQIHHGLAKNYGRFSLYFESTTALASGTLLFIRTAGGGSGEFSDAGKSSEVTALADRDDHKRIPGACSELKTLVVAQVRRCVEITNSSGTLYGTGVEYVSPAV